MVNTGLFLLGLIVETACMKYLSTFELAVYIWHQGSVLTLYLLNRFFKLRQVDRNNGAPLCRRGSKPVEEAIQALIIAFYRLMKRLCELEGSLCAKTPMLSI